FFYDDNTFAVFRWPRLELFDLVGGTPPTEADWPFEDSPYFVNPVLPDGRLCGLRIVEDMAYVRIIAPGQPVKNLTLPLQLGRTKFEPVVSRLSATGDRFALGMVTWPGSTTSLTTLVWDCASAELIQSLTIPNYSFFDDPGKMALNLAANSRLLVATI